MPTYLLHGFRWPREAIRIHIILQNLDEAAAEWLVAPATTATMLSNFHEIYPDCMEHLSELRFVEQYDPNDTSAGAGSQPFAYVTDVCQEIKLGVDIDEVRGKGVPNNQWAAMMELRDKLAQQEKVAWYVVVCGDEDRWAPGPSTSSESVPHEGSTGASQTEEDSEASDVHSSVGNEDAAPDIAQSSQADERKGLKKFFFSGLGKRKNPTDLEHTKSMESMKPAVREHTGMESQKYASGSTSLDDSKQKAVMPGSRRPAQRASMPKLQTQDLHVQISSRTLPGPGPMVASPGGLSLIEDDDEDREIITGPAEDDDDMAAPAPTIKHGKQQDLVSRQRKRSSIASFTSAVRGRSPETLRHISPLVRQHPDSFSNAAHFSPIEQPHQPHQLQYELRPDDIDEEPAKPKSISPPASYVPTGAPASGVASIRTSRSTSPIKIASRQRSSSRLSTLNALEDNSPMSSSPPRRTGKGLRSRRSSVQATNLNGLNKRASQYSVSSMSNAMSQLYTAHERDFNKHRQSVTQDDLVARGLEDMDFAALR